MRELEGVKASFWFAVEPGMSDDECWNWTGVLNSHGYGSFHYDGRRQGAHRIAYQFEVGPIPDGLQIDHLCRNRRCVNPSHMELVTSRENTLRGRGLAAQNARKTHCQHGHEFTAENTDEYRGTRRCVECRRAYQREAYHARS